MLLAGTHGVLEETAELLEHLAARLVLRRHGLEDRPELSHQHGDGVFSPHLSPGTTQFIDRAKRCRKVRKLHAQQSKVL